jgi:Competence protein J (ComJ)
MSNFSISVSYQQIAVFLGELDQPFNDWTERHVAQGFSWREGSVSFRTPNDGPMCVSVGRGGGFSPSPDAVRVIRVPFVVPSTGGVEVASIADSCELGVTPGLYGLTFECGIRSEDGMWCRLHFEPTSSPVEAEILRADAELSPGPHLLMEAKPA